MKTSVSTMMFDLNEHYIFNSLDNLEFYGLGGLNLLFARKKEGQVTPEKDTSIGFNIGVGTYMKMTEQLDVFVEGKYIISRNDQFMLNIGVLLNLQWLSKNENPGI
jgi:hypothetical protein